MYNIDSLKPDGWVILSPSRGKRFMRKGDPAICFDGYGRNPVVGKIAWVTSAGGAVVEAPSGFRQPAAPPNSDRIWPIDLFHPPV